MNLYWQLVETSYAFIFRSRPNRAFHADPVLLGFRPRRCEAQTCVPPASGIVSRWRAESDSTDFWGTNNGTLAGNATYAAGFVGQAFNFDGDGDAVQLPTQNT